MLNEVCIGFHKNATNFIQNGYIYNLFGRHNYLLHSHNLAVFLAISHFINNLITCQLGDYGRD